VAIRDERNEKRSSKTSLNGNKQRESGSWRECEMIHLSRCGFSFSPILFWNFVTSFLFQNCCLFFSALLTWSLRKEDEVKTTKVAKKRRCRHTAASTCAPKEISEEKCRRTVQNATRNSPKLMATVTEKMALQPDVQFCIVLWSLTYMLLIFRPHNERIDNHCPLPRAFQGGQWLLCCIKGKKKLRERDAGEKANHYSGYIWTMSRSIRRLVKLLLLLTGNEINGDRNFLSALAEKREIRTRRTKQKNRKEEIDEKVNFKWTSQGGRDLLHRVGLCNGSLDQ